MLYRYSAPSLCKRCIGQNPYIFVVDDALGADGTRVNFWWSTVAANVSGNCNEEEYDRRRVITPRDKMCTVQHQPYIPQGTEVISRVRCAWPPGSEQKER